MKRKMIIAGAAGTFLIAAGAAAFVFGSNAGVTAEAAEGEAGSGDQVHLEPAAALAAEDPHPRRRGERRVVLLVRVDGSVHAHPDYRIGRT